MALIESTHFSGSKWTNLWAVEVRKDVQLSEKDVDILAKKYGFVNRHQVECIHHSPIHTTVLVCCL